MIMLQLMEFVKNWKRNVPVALISSIVAVILILVYGMLSYENNRVKPFRDIENEKGFVSHEDLRKFVPYAKENLNTVSFAELLLDDGGMTLLAIDDWVSSWRPRLKKGKLMFTPEADGTIPVVVGDVVEDEYKIGDTFDVRTYEGDNFTLKVTGIAVTGTSVLAPCEEYKADAFDYRMAYSSEVGPYVLCARTLLPEKLECLFEEGLSFAVMGDDISDEEYREAYNRIRRKTGGACIEISDFAKNCDEVYKEKLMTYMPLVIMGTVVMVICCLAAIYVNYRYAVRHYTIYYLLGCKKSQRLTIALTGSVGIAVSSMLMTWIMLMYGRAFNMFEKYMVYITKETYWILFAYYLVFILLVVIITTVSMRSVSPKEQIAKIRR